MINTADFMKYPIIIMVKQYKYIYIFKYKTTNGKSVLYYKLSLWQ